MTAAEKQHLHPEGQNNSPTLQTVTKHLATASHDHKDDKSEESEYS